MNKMHRTWPNGTVLVVTHRDTMLAFDARVAPRPLAELRRVLLSRNPKDQIHNGQVVHFTRRDPHSSEINVRFTWFRSICPWDPSRSVNGWQAIRPPYLSGEELLGVAEEAIGGDWAATHADASDSGGG